MNLLNKYWFNTKLNKKVRIEKRGRGLLFENKSKDVLTVRCFSTIKTEKDYLRISFKGQIVNNQGYCLLNIYNTKKENFGSLTLGSDSFIETKSKRLLFVLRIQAGTKVLLNEIEVSALESLDSFYTNILPSDFLIITPSYPAPENKYLSGFVHSRLKAYKKAGIKFTLVCSFIDYKEYSRYEFEGIEVLRVPLQGLRTIMRMYDFKKIATHFFDWRYARILDASDLLNKQLYIWVHGPETLYWDWPYFTTRYFKPLSNITPEQELRFKENDKIVQRYNQMGNVHWIFVSNWIKEHSEELIGIKFNNFSIIPNFIDEENFSYLPKEYKQRNKIFMLRRYDDINKYAVDIAVRAIMELSKKDFFNNLEFNIYGTGDSHDKLFAPLLSFSNIHFYRDFLTHKEIGKVHKKNGVAFFPTRYDAQGVSMCEAAMSGLAVISSDNEAIKEFIPSVDGNILPTEDFHAYAKQIEKLYKDEKYFLELSEKCHEKVSKKCSFGETIAQEIKLLKQSKTGNSISNINPVEGSVVKKDKILTVIVPSYNVQDFLRTCVNSLLNHLNRDYVEVLIVNDGSTDNTLEVARQLEKSWNRTGENLVKIINKENGGHGSTINVGIKNSSAKYVRVIDSDDWVNSFDLANLIDVLKIEDSDLVLTNYSEDRVEYESLLKQYPYEMLIPGVKYNLNDLCNGDSYGFNKWGPILATSNFKTELLKKTGFALTEKTPYVDMEFNMYSIKNVESVTFYNLDIYRYFIGRSGQTISQNSYMKNYLKHENIIFNMVNYISQEKSFSKNKRKYIDNMLIGPMIRAQYLIIMDYFRSPRKFRLFDSKLKEYPYYYNSESTHKLNILLGRKTGGFGVIFTPITNILAENKTLDQLAVSFKRIILKN